MDSYTNCTAAQKKEKEKRNEQMRVRLQSEMKQAFCIIFCLFCATLRWTQQKKQMKNTQQRSKVNKLYAFLNPNVNLFRIMWNFFVCSPVSQMNFNSKRHTNSYKAKKITTFIQGHWQPTEKTQPKVPWWTFCIILHWAKHSAQVCWQHNYYWPCWLRELHAM